MRGGTSPESTGKRSDSISWDRDDGIVSEVLGRKGSLRNRSTVHELYQVLDLQGLDLNPPVLANNSQFIGRELDISCQVRFSSFTNGSSSYEKDIRDLSEFLGDANRISSALFGVDRGVRTIGLLRYEGSALRYALNNGALELTPGDVVGWTAYQSTPWISERGIRSGLEMEKRGEGSEQIYKIMGTYLPRFRRGIEFIGSSDTEYAGVVGATLVVGVRPDLRGGGLGQALLQGAQQDLYRQGHKLAVSYARLPQFGGYMRETYPSIETNEIRWGMATNEVHDYVDQLRRGEIKDWGVGFHQKAGGTLLCGAPQCTFRMNRPKDFTTMDSGAVIVTDLVSLCGNGSGDDVKSQGLTD